MLIDEISTTNLFMSRVSEVYIVFTLESRYVVGDL